MTLAGECQSTLKLTLVGRGSASPLTSCWGAPQPDTRQGAGPARATGEPEPPPQLVPLSKSMGLQATRDLDSENESLQAQLAEAYSAAMAETDRELADLRARLAQASGPPALTVLAGKAEQP